MSLCNYVLSFIDALYVSAWSSSTQQYINQMSLCNVRFGFSYTTIYKSNAFYTCSLYVSARSSSTQQYINQMSL